MAHFNGGQSPDINFMVTRLGKTQEEAIDYVKSSLREKYRDFEKLWKEFLYQAKWVG